MSRNKKTNKAKAKRTLAYITRGQALKKLQLSLKDFRRLCIIKGIYPVEPGKKASRSQPKTYYLLKDIQYLSHERLIWKFWDFKIFVKRIAKAKGRKDNEWVQRIRENKPIVKLDHIVRERYPTFIDALRDLDDALSMCFLYAMFGKSKSLPLELIELSRRLTLEFMYYVMETKSLRKVFISIKGYYYEANIMGQDIRWIVPHQFVLKHVPDVDFQIMKTFTEFYVTVLGFVNYKLYTSNSYYYPPKLFNSSDNSDKETDYDVNDVIASLNRPLANNGVNNKFQDEHAQIDEFENQDDEEVKFGASVMSFGQLQKLQKLFSGLKFFLNREVPRESLCFVIRSFSGEVSWDKSLFDGATFSENDPTITHQIVDRETTDRLLNRHYIQPQWVFDCINARKLLSEQNYFFGVKLPPHLSPFVEERPGEYIPPEKLSLLGMEKPTQVENEVLFEESNNRNQKKVIDTDESNMNGDKQFAVKKGTFTVENNQEITKRKESEEKRLRVMMIPKKQKKLYNRIVKSVKRKNHEVENLKRKRRDYEMNQKKKLKKMNSKNFETN